MTLVVGTLEGIYADRRITDPEGKVFDPIRKVAANSALAAGFAGSFERILTALDAVRAGAAPEDLTKLGVDGVVLTPGQLYLLDAGRLFPVREPFTANGTGYLEARAFLTGKGKWTEHAVKACHRYVASVRTDCGDGVNFTTIRKK